MCTIDELKDENKKEHAEIGVEISSMKKQLDGLDTRIDSLVNMIDDPDFRMKDYKKGYEEASEHTHPSQQTMDMIDRITLALDNISDRLHDIEKGFADLNERATPAIKAFNDTTVSGKVAMTILKGVVWIAGAVITVFGAFAVVAEVMKK